MEEYRLEELPDTEELWQVPEPKIISALKPGTVRFACCTFDV